MDNSARNVWQVLHIDDDEDDYFLTREMLRQAQGRKIIFDWAPTYEAGQHQLQTNDYDAVLVDYDLGVHTGIEFIREITSQGVRVPIILYTGRGSYEVDVEAMQAGATLYLTKGEVNPLLLERSIRYAIERKRLEQERTDLVESIQDGFFAIDKDWQITYINHRAAKNGGFEPEELIGKNIWEAFPSLLGTPLELYYRLVMHERKSVKFEMPGVVQKIWYSVSVYPFREGISIYWQDITERKQAEEAQRTQETTLRGILDATKESVWLFDPDGIILLGNETALSRLKRPAEEVIGRNFNQFMPVELAQARQARLREVVETGQPVEFEDQRAGIAFLHNFYPNVDAAGQVTSIADFSRDITERKRADEALRDSEHKLSTILGTIVDGFYALDRDLHFTYINDATGPYFGIYGLSQEELLGRSIFDVFPQLRGSVFEKGFRRALDSGEIVHLEARSALSDRMMDVHLYPGSDILTVLVRDVTERYRVEVALREKEEMLRLALNAGQAGAWSWDLGTNDVQWSDEYYSIFGFKPGSIQPSAEVGFSHVHPDDLPRIEAAVREAIERGTHIDEVHRVTWPDGSDHWVRGISRAFYDEHGKPARMAGIAFDITDQKQAEIALRAAHRQTFEILESISDAFYSLDGENRFTYVNQKAASLWGKDPKDLLGKIIWEIFPAGKGTESYQKIQQAIQERRPSHYESYSAFLDQWIDIHVYPTENGVSVYFQDITERKQKEETMAAYAQKLERSNRDLQEFAFVASHDLQEPLRKIEALGDMILRESAALTEQHRDQFERMRKSAGRMRTMVEGLLQLSRLATQAQPFQPVDLHQVTQEVVSDLELQIKRTGGVLEVCELPVIQADPLQMRQLLQNLIGNALKFQPPGGKPQVKVFSRQSTPETVQIIVKDNGIGFDQALAGRIFQPFQRLVGKSEFEGSGMGLAIARNIVERHGGEITVHSKNGQGATFIVTLPNKQNVSGY